MKKMNLTTAAAKLDTAFAPFEKSAFRAALLSRNVWEAWKTGNVVDENGEAVKTFAAVAKAATSEAARRKADKFAAVGLFVDNVDGKAVVADVVAGYEFGNVYALSYRAEARRAYDAGGITEARAAVADFIKKHEITAKTSVRDIEKAGKPAKDNGKARAEIKAAEDSEAARLDAKAEAEAKEAAAKEAAALALRKADFDAAMEIFRANYVGLKSEADKLIRAARKAAFGGVDYEASEYIAARKKEAARKAEAEAEAKRKAAEDKEAARAGKGGGASHVVLEKPDAKPDAKPVNKCKAGKAEAAAKAGKSAYIDAVNGGASKTDAKAEAAKASAEAAAK